MKLTAKLVAGMLGAALVIGCAAGPEAWQIKRAPAEAQGTVSLLDVRWARAGFDGPVAAAGAEEPTPSDRLSAPEAYTAAQRGRVTPEAVPKLPPLPPSEVWRPGEAQGPRPELAYDPNALQAQVKPPVPGVKEILEAAEGETD